jgi:hypothetical protein
MMMMIIMVAVFIASELLCIPMKMMIIIITIKCFSIKECHPRVYHQDTPLHHQHRHHHHYPSHHHHNVITIIIINQLPS